MPQRGQRQNGQVEIAEYVDRLEAEGRALADAAERGGIEAAIEHCPDWTVRDLLGHIGYIHRWATDIVAGALPSPEGVGNHEPPDDDELVRWVGDGHRNLVNTLRTAPDDVECFAFLPAPSPLAFWAQRQAMETAVHRVDVESAAGDITPIDEALALSGLEEMLLGFGARRKTFEPGTMRLAPGDGEHWLVVLGATGAQPSRVTPDDDTTTDVTISGSASDVYLWTWNRPAAVTITGDRAVADQWAKVRVRWS
jgi:uncharacterized protein (TIGR03083 family)